MSQIFLSILNMTIYASYIILLIFILKLLFKKIPTFMCFILWGFVAFKLICPFSFETNFSLVPQNTLIQSVRSQNANLVTTNSNSIGTENFNNETPKNPNELPSKVKNNSNKNNILFNLGVVYIVGTFVMLTFALISYLHLKKIVSVSIKKKDNIYICDKISEPFTLGMLVPKIYLPSKIEQKDEEYILMHEKAHLKRGDNFWKPFGYILLSIHWFNPLVWLAYIQFCKDVEVATDEIVIKKLETEKRKEYSSTLLTYSINNQKLVTACPVAFGETSVKDRIKSILNYKKPSVIIILISIVLCLVIAVCFMTTRTVDIENAENLNYEDLVTLQNEVNNGHYPWRLVAEETAMEFILNKTGLTGGKIISLQNNSKKSNITISFPDNIEYKINLIKPLQKDNLGIWVVKDYSSNTD